MFTYKYNLRSLGFPEDQYNSISNRALSLARRASAVDTGRFKYGWTTTVSGDILLVQNGVRYAPFVELGSIVYRFHRYKIRRALASIGLTNGTEKFNNQPVKSFSVGGSEPKTTESSKEEKRTKVKIVSPTKPLTEQEIRSPALLLNRLKVDRATKQTAPKAVSKIPKAQLFNRSRLLELLVAAEIARQTNNNEE